MSTPRTHHRNWDEFRWEQEIRRDERRINCYFRTIPSCLDLPGEEEMVNGTIAAQSDLLSTVSVSGGVTAPWSYLQITGDEAEEHGEPAHTEGRRPGEYLIESIDKLASQWNVHCALNPEIQYAALSIACAYAKLLARCADFLDIADNNIPLKRCLGKRCLGDLLVLNTYLEMLAESAPHESAFAEFHQKRLIGLREQLSNMLAKCK